MKSKGSSALLPATVAAFICGFALGSFWTNLATRAHDEVESHPAELTFSRRAPHLNGDERLALVERRLAALELSGKASPPHEGAIPAAKDPETPRSPVRHGRAGGGRPGGSECGGEGKRYHVLLTAQDSPYQAWQTRIMYYHFQKQKKLDPCGEMGGALRAAPALSRETP